MEWVSVSWWISTNKQTNINKHKNIAHDHDDIVTMVMLYNDIRHRCRDATVCMNDHNIYEVS